MQFYLSLFLSQFPVTESLFTSVFDAESVQICSALCGIFCPHIHGFKNTAPNVAHRGPAQAKRRGHSRSTAIQLLRQRDSAELLHQLRVRLKIQSLLFMKHMGGGGCPQGRDIDPTSSLFSSVKTVIVKTVPIHIGVFPACRQILVCTFQRHFSHEKSAQKGYK